MGDRVKNILKIMSMPAMSAILIMSIIMLLASTSRSQLSLEESSSSVIKDPNLSFLSYREETSKVDNLPVQIELTLQDKDWITPNNPRESKVIPLKVRITNLSNLPIRISNRAVRSFFDLSIIDEYGNSIVAYDTFADGSAPRVGDPFPESSACPVILPRASIEGDWNFQINRDNGSTAIYSDLIKMRQIWQPAWKFLASRPGQYRIRLSYTNLEIGANWCDGGGSQREALALGKAVSNTLMVHIMLEP